MRKLILVVGLVVVAFACSEPVGEMLIDAGEMMRDGGVADASSGVDGSVGTGGTGGTGGSGMATGGASGGSGMATGGASGGGGPAALQPHPVTCDRERVTTTKNYDGEGQLNSTTTQRQSYGVLDVPDFTTVGVERCRPFADDTWVSCPPDDDRREVTCTGLLQDQGCDYFVGGYHRGSTFYVQCDNVYNVDYVDPAQEDFSGGVTYTRVTAYY